MEDRAWRGDARTSLDGAMERQIIGSVQQRCREEGGLSAVSKYHLPSDRSGSYVEVWCSARARREDRKAVEGQPP